MIFPRIYYTFFVFVETSEILFFLTFNSWYHLKYASVNLKFHKKKKVHSCYRKNPAQIFKIRLILGARMSRFAITIQYVVNYIQIEERAEESNRIKIISIILCNSSIFELDFLASEHQI